MQNKIDKVDFENSIYRILQEFLTTQYDVSDDNEYIDWWVCYDYDDVKNTFSHMINDNIPYKPVIHFVLNAGNNQNEYYISNVQKAEDVFLSFSVFIVIDDVLVEDFQYDINKPLMILNKLAGNLKYKFDTYKGNMNELDNVRINVSNGMLGKNPDNLYAKHQTLKFKVIKQF